MKNLLHSSILAAGLASVASVGLAAPTLSSERNESSPTARQAEADVHGWRSEAGAQRRAPKRDYREAPSKHQKDARRKARLSFNASVNNEDGLA